MRTLAASALGLLMLTAWRVTHLVVADTFPPIAWARARAERGPAWLGDLATCAYCAGVWVAAALVLACDWLFSVPLPWLVFGAVAAAVPIIEAAVARLEREPAAGDAPPRPPQPTTYTRTRAGT
jgi:Protein of unknown function (DUF1360)